MQTKKVIECSWIIKPLSLCGSVFRSQVVGWQGIMHAQGSAPPGFVLLLHLWMTQLPLGGCRTAASVECVFLFLNSAQNMGTVAASSLCYVD